MDEQTRMAIDRLNSSTDFQRFVELLEAHRLDRIKQATSQVEPHLIFRAQGGVEFADQLLDDIQKIKSPPGPKKRQRF